MYTHTHTYIYIYIYMLRKLSGEGVEESLEIDKGKVPILLGLYGKWSFA
jgi:hypothetical protein